MKSDSKRTNADMFAVIGAQAARSTAVLQRPALPRIPRKTIRLEEFEGSSVPSWSEEIADAAGLAEELDRTERQYAPYLRELAPHPKQTRKVIPLVEFSWRIATSEDLRCPVDAIAGQGRWEQVRIPHYGEPIGRATTYYRTEFELTADDISRRISARFEGVDYIAHVFLNGAYVGSHEGLFAPFSIELSCVVRRGVNALCIRVENDNTTIGATNHIGHPRIEGDKIYAATGPGYDEPINGWHHCPPGMGIHLPAFIEIGPRVTVSDLFVRPMEKGVVEIWTEVNNAYRGNRAVEIRASIFGRNFKKTIFRNRPFPKLPDAGPGVNFYRFKVSIPTPKYWEPETPWLYALQIEVVDLDSGEADRDSCSFGLRTFVMDEAVIPKGRLLLNGREIRLRGANTMGFEQRSVMAGDWTQLRKDLLMAKAGRLNFLRFTQRPVPREVYDLCDRLGLLNQTDLPLFGHLRRNLFCEAVRQAQVMERFIRRHPSAVIISYINEPYPMAWGDRSHRQLTRPELESFFAAATLAVRIANPDRVVKPTDGDYDGPSPGICDLHCYTFWYNGHGIDVGLLHKGGWMPVKPDWTYACGEFGAEGLDCVALMQKHCPPEWLPQSAEEAFAWSPARISRAQTGKFHRLFFDTQHTLEGWVQESQRHQSESTKLMTEALRRHDRLNSFAIHLFIDAWPTGWMKAIVDCERQPKPAFFAYRSALAPMAVQLRTDRRHYYSEEPIQIEAWVCNDHARSESASLDFLWEVDGQPALVRTLSLEVPAMSARCVGVVKFTAPKVMSRTGGSLKVALQAGGMFRHNTRIDLEIWPDREVAAAVHALGRPKGTARGLVSELGMANTPREDARVVICDDFALYRANARWIDRFVSHGGRLVLIDLPPGEYVLKGEKIKVEPCRMNGRHFVSRATGHPLVASFLPKDFNYWHSPAEDRITPLLTSLVMAPRWTPVLLTTQEGEGGTWHDAHAVAEMKQGKGSVIVCQLDLRDRLATNPPAKVFAQQLLQSNFL